MDAEVLIVAAVALTGLVLLGWGGRRHRGRRSAEPPPVTGSPLHSPAERRLHDVELRLYEFGRETEARLQTALVQLDRLIVDAERASARLAELLADARLAAGELSADEGRPDQSRDVAEMPAEPLPPDLPPPSDPQFGDHRRAA